MGEKTILVTGGAGYIGSHTCVELAAAGYRVVVADNLDNSQPLAVQRVSELCGQDIPLHRVDTRDSQSMQALFAQYAFTAVLHFADHKAVGESVQNPLKYFQNNLSGCLLTLRLMQAFGVKNFVFSSSATVYGEPQRLPITEDFPLHPTNPYGEAKWMVEKILHQAYQADNSWNIAILRYFNPVGAHASGCIGENPSGIPNNLMPYIAMVATGKLPQLRIFGQDYPTADGTGVRDYIHVVDLAQGHVNALQKLETNPGLVIYNLGTGQGYSVLEMVQAFERATGMIIPYQFAPRRPGDIAACYADPSLAARELGWKASRGLEQMCADTWRWQNNHPNGFGSQ